MSINPEDFKFLVTLIKDKSGIALTEEKEYLLEGRLMPLVKKYELNDIAAYVTYLKQNMHNAAAIEELIEAMTTNESFFFRDIKPFDRLRDIIIPQLLEANPGKVNYSIWCAACSTGQEPYSVALSILENPKCNMVNFEIIATDIDNKVLEKSQEGIYTQFEVQRGMPVPLLLKYFTQEGDKWKIKDDPKKLIKFENFNLMDDTSKFGSIDLVFCRNVLIYFDAPTKEKILNNIAARMTKSSALFLGTAEGLLGLNVNLEQYDDLSGIFRLKD